MFEIICSCNSHHSNSKASKMNYYFLWKVSLSASLLQRAVIVDRYPPLGTKISVSNLNQFLMRNQTNIYATIVFFFFFSSLMFSIKLSIHIPFSKYDMVSDLISDSTSDITELVTYTKLILWAPIISTIPNSQLTKLTSDMFEAQ